jgi:hypothetical protein
MVFRELRDVVGLSLGKVTVASGDALDLRSWPTRRGIGTIVTSPPYLPASSGREHYASSRALAFAVLGFNRPEVRPVASNFKCRSPGYGQSRTGCGRCFFARPPTARREAPRLALRRMLFEAPIGCTSCRVRRRDRSLCCRHPIISSSRRDGSRVTCQRAWPQRKQMAVRTNLVGSGIGTGACQIPHINH